MGQSGHHECRSGGRRPERRHEWCPDWPTSDTDLWSTGPEGRLISNPIFYTNDAIINNLANSLIKTNDFFMQEMKKRLMRYFFMYDVANWKSYSFNFEKSKNVSLFDESLMGTFSLKIRIKNFEYYSIIIRNSGKPQQVVFFSPGFCQLWRIGLPTVTDWFTNCDVLQNTSQLANYIVVCVLYWINKCIKLACMCGEIC